MTENKHLNSFGQYIRSQLHAAKIDADAGARSQMINVAGVGHVVSAAYEQLRNAAEYTQEHLLRQKAIRRFYIRNIQFFNTTTVNRSIAEELIVELTQAGYIDNDTLPVETIDRLHAAVTQHYETFWELKASGIARETAREWTLQLLSVHTERLIETNPQEAAYVRLAFHHYQATLSSGAYLAEDSDKADYDPCLYVAVHKALLKSDIANVRYDMLQLYSLNADNIAAYGAFHKNIDRLFQSELTDRLTRHINKYGAPLRVLRSLIEDNQNIDELLLDHKRFLGAYEAQVTQEYEKARHKVNKGLGKSIAFLLITKTLIGMGIEIPYDVWVVGHIAVLPLVVNLFSPIVYMLLLGWGLTLPGETNTRAMRDYMDAMLYGASDSPSLYPSTKKSGYSRGFTVVYGILTAVVLGLVANTLMTLGFNVVQGVIFFVFFATASFLGFRLSRIIRELELVVTKQSFVNSIRDFIYMPFILLGQWLSEKYQKVNIIALILDTVIELPLKTILRLIRQWTSFIGEKRDDI